MEEDEAEVRGREVRGRKEGAGALADYRRTQSVRDFVGTFFGEAALAGLPVTIEQADGVTAMLIHSRPCRAAGSLSQLDPATIAVRPERGTNGSGASTAA